MVDLVIPDTQHGLQPDYNGMTNAMSKTATTAANAAATNEATTTAKLGRGPRLSWHRALQRYLVVILLGNLVWEFAQMPLYTIWKTGTWSEIVFAAVHCTGGDILIALSALTLALMIAGNENWPLQKGRIVGGIALGLGVAYTVFSEWLNIVIRAAWAYSDLMPVIAFNGFQVGLSPLLQWILIPLAGFWSASLRDGTAARRLVHP